MIRFNRKSLILFLRWGFGLLLILAAIDKIRNPFAFAAAVENYQIFSADLSRWIAVWMPSLEVTVGLFLIIGIWQDAAILLNMILMILFLLLVTQAFLRGLDIRCGCFFVEGESKIGLLKILENFVLAVLSVLLYLIWRRQLSRVE